MESIQGIRNTYIDWKLICLFIREAYYTGVRQFNRIQRNIFTMKHDKNLFRPALRSYLLEHCFYSVNEFIDQTGTLV
jgi:hypothetical protein